MARIRSVKPEFWLDPKITRLSRDARLLYIAIWNQADEHGRLLGDPRVIKGQAFPYDDDLTADRIDRLIDELQCDGKAIRYDVDEAPYLYLPKLKKHQRLEPDKVPSRLPAPPAEHETPTRPDPSEVDADSSESRADESAPDADALSLLHVASSKEHGARQRRVNSSATSDFDEFWALYPRKVEKLKAKKVWPRAVKAAGSAEPIIAGIKAQLPKWHKSEPKFVPYPTTWLNGGRWEDEVEQVEQQSAAAGWWMQ